MYYSDLPQNKYTACYIKLMHSRLNNPKVKGKTESHHIFPVAIFGSSNIKVNLTFREHFMAHMLLWKAYAKSLGNKSSLTCKMYRVIYYFRNIAVTKDNKQVVLRLKSRGFGEVKALSYIKNNK